MCALPSRDIDPSTMEPDKKLRTCLVCSIPISECHLGIDSCRSCAVFYKRICATNRPPTKCKREDGMCFDNEVIASCRKCRYERFSEIMEKAFAEDNEEEKIVQEIAHIVCDPVKLDRTDKTRQATHFIDHNTYLLDQPSCAETPLLNKIRWSYSILCQTRNCGEIATKPVTAQYALGNYEGTDIEFSNTTYSMIVPNIRLMFSALFDFGRATFPDFAKLEAESRSWCIQTNYEQFSLIESMYRANHHFPDDLDTHFASYTTIMNETFITAFLEDCPFETKIEDVASAFKISLNRQKSMNRVNFHRVNPDDIEILALLGLSFWNNELASINDELYETAEKYRAIILKELHHVYKSRGKSDYATRLGELFCLVDNMEENVSLAKHDIEVFRMLNMFNECFPTDS